MSVKRWLGVALVAVVVIAVGFVVWQRRGQQAATDATMDTAVVQRGDLVDTVSGTGALAPRQSIDVAFASGGQVAEVLVAEGDTVSAGQPLAVLDTYELGLNRIAAESDLASAESSLASARSSHEALLAGPDELEIASAQLSIDQAKDALWGRQSSRDGVCGRVKAGLGQKYECDSAESSVLQAEGSVRSAELSMQQLLEGAADDAVAASESKVTSAQAQVKAAQNKVEQARLRLQEATLTSPITGTVTALSVVAGETAGASGAAATVADLSRLDVEIMLDETDVAQVSVGMSATVTLDAFPDDPFGGQVVSIAPTGASESGVVLFPVTVSVEPGDLAARPGMTAEVEVVIQSVRNTLIVPLRAVTSTPRGSMVLLVPQSPEAATAAADAAMGSGFRARGGAIGDATRQGAPGGAGASGQGAFRPPSGVTAGTAGARGVLAQVASSGGVPTQVEVGMTTSTEAEILSGLEEGDVVLVPTSTTANQGQGFGGPGFGMRIFRGEP